ncbi:hypothetical protein [Siminovitchia terrae]|nr:hypothetical protein [Siminovitchia terrae]
MEDQIQEFVYLRPNFILIIFFLVSQLVILLSGNSNKLINRFFSA